MDEQKRHNLTVKIADVPPFSLPVTLNEESFYRHIIGQVNKVWLQMRDGCDAEMTKAALAKVALYYAEMYYRKSALLNEHGKVIDDFEHQLDTFLGDFDSSDTKY